MTGPGSPLDAVAEQIRRGGDTIECVERLLNPAVLSARALPVSALLDVLLRLAGPEVDGPELLAALAEEASRRGWPRPASSPSAPVANLAGIWLHPDVADVQHGQVWTVLARGGSIVTWAQIDGYETEIGRKSWRAVNIETRRTVRVLKVLQGSCPRIGGRRERAKR